MGNIGEKRSRGVRIMGLVCLFVVLIVYLMQASTAIFLIAQQAPILSVEPASFELRIKEGLNPSPLSLTIHNAGSGEMLYMISANVAWLFADGSGTLLAGESETRSIIVDSSSLLAGKNQRPGKGTQSNPIQIATCRAIML